ncbi:unnamed protein product [Angiostrongylus costaricensis]|uniref:DUF3444 domain-containing protein n=1 Tax=Angiostrongylus costaricensis TaxID=334426 RepID=A0A0R3PE69_ANGCS|nr:unnamed protein product [Angiostrongylus costaricensis]
MAGPINWMSNSKDSRYVEGSGKRREPTFRPIPLPTEMDHNSIPVRNRWKKMGKNQQVRRVFVPAGLSMFAETMRACLEEHHGRVFSSFSEVVNNSIPFWDKLSDSDQEGWTARARVEKKNDHYIYIRKAREKVCIEQKVIASQLSDYESDPDELPGEICIVKSSERLVYAYYQCHLHNSGKEEDDIKWHFHIWSFTHEVIAR